MAVASPSAGSRFLLTIWVDDIDAACAELADQEVGLLNGPVDRSGAKTGGPRRDAVGRTIGVEASQAGVISTGTAA